MQLVDTHAHLDYLACQGGDPDIAMAQAKDAGVAWLVNPSITPDRFGEVMAMAERYPNVFAAVAIHPTDADPATLTDTTWHAAIDTLLKHPKVVALGETGLDYYHDTTHVAEQHACFRWFLDKGRATNTPVIVHDRDAHDDVARLIDEYPGVRGVMHCFSGDVAFAQAMIARGFYISFAGNVTFKNAVALQEAATAVPLNRLLIETDAPFLSPMPFRGQPNEPARVRLVAEKIAALKGISLDTLAKATTENAHQVFAPCFS